MTLKSLGEPPRKWREGDILYAENDWVRMAFVVTDDLTKLGQMGWHNDICVEYISADTAKLWPDEQC